MNGNILAKVFYTPVKNPEEVRCIEVKEKSDLDIINRFFKRIVSKKLKKLSITAPNFRVQMLKDLMDADLNISTQEVRKLFQNLYDYMYGRAKEEKKYWCLIITEEYFFIYHFTPDRAVSFERNSIIEFIKYLDDTSLLKFIFKLKSDYISSYFEELSEQEIKQIQSQSKNVYGIFDKSATKGMKKLTGEEPEYEFKGELRVRIKRSDKTDIVVETSLEDLENINSNVKFDFEEGLATIKVENAPIIELVVDGDKYDVKTGIKRIQYETLSIGNFIEKYRFYKNDNDDEVKEFKDYVIVGSRRIDKPESNLKGKEETIFILGDDVSDNKNLIESSFEAIKNNFNVAFVELSGFSADYDEINIGYFTIFGKLKEYEKVKTIENTFRTMLDRVKGNLTLEKTLHYVGLITISELFKSKGFREKLYQIGKLALSDYYLNMPKRNIELKEIDKLSIEFKTGIKKFQVNGQEKEEGFFNPSPKEFANRVLEKFRRKDTVIFFVGINEDTRDFSPIPLSQIRNEFHENLKENISQNGVNVLLSETVPISDDKGILILVLQKGENNENV
ncbi:MAG: hypothetical protein ABIL76_01040 [candidate division WOR-3 bacterium]